MNDSIYYQDFDPMLIRAAPICFQTMCFQVSAVLRECCLNQKAYYFLRLRHVIAKKFPLDSEKLVTKCLRESQHYI